MMVCQFHILAAELYGYLWFIYEVLWVYVHTGCSPDVHGFEIACLDDAHSDGVGSGIVTQRQKEVSSTPLKKGTQ